jgi:hypothetical protein
MEIKGALQIAVTYIPVILAAILILGAAYGGWRWLWTRRFSLRVAARFPQDNCCVIRSVSGAPNDTAYISAAAVWIELTITNLGTEKKIVTEIVTRVGGSAERAVLAPLVAFLKTSGQTVEVEGAMSLPVGLEGRAPLKLFALIEAPIEKPLGTLLFSFYGQAAFEKALSVRKVVGVTMEQHYERLVEFMKKGMTDVESVYRIKIKQFRVGEITANDAILEHDKQGVRFRALYGHLPSEARSKVLHVMATESLGPLLMRQSRRDLEITVRFADGPTGKARIDLGTDALWFLNPSDG